MSITIGDKPEMNVVNVGDEITSDQLAAIQGSLGASSSNPFVTSSDLTGYAQLSQNNQFTSTNTFSGFTGFSGTVQATMAVGLTGVPLTINNYGTGNSFVVNDQISDPTPFVINNIGLVGLNVSNPAAMLDIAHSLTSGTGIRLSVASGQAFTHQAGLLFVNIANTGASGKAFVIENRGTGDCIYIHDQAATDTTAFVVNNAGDCIIGGQTITAGYKLDVRGNIISDNLKTGTIEFSDLTSQTTAYNPIYSASTALGTVTPDYPHELELVVGGVTYRVPARAI